MKHILLGFNHKTLALIITELMGLQWVMYIANHCPEQRGPFAQTIVIYSKRLRSRTRATKNPLTPKTRCVK